MAVSMQNRPAATWLHIWNMLVIYVQCAESIFPDLFSLHIQSLCGASEILCDGLHLDIKARLHEIIFNKNNDILLLFLLVFR